MSLSLFRRLLPEANYSKDDKKWFPKWLGRYAAGKSLPHGKLTITQELVIEFSRSLLHSGTPAWQRLQAVRAVEAYRDLVLKSTSPSLQDIKIALARRAEIEKIDQTPPSQPDQRNETQLVGRIDPSEPPIIQKTRRELRVRRKALRTEQAYIGWIQRFIQYCGSPNLDRFGETQIKSFVTRLATVIQPVRLLFLCVSV